MSSGKNITFVPGETFDAIRKGADPVIQHTEGMISE
jgi:hypothetical protein